MSVEKLQKALSEMTVAEITKWAKEKGFSKTAGKRKADLIQYVVEEWSKLKPEQQSFPASKDPAYVSLLSKIERVQKALDRLKTLTFYKTEQLSSLMKEKEKYEK